MYKVIIHSLENCEKQSEGTVDKIPAETDYMSLREIGSTIYLTRLCIIHYELHIQLLCNLSNRSL